MTYQIRFADGSMCDEGPWDTRAEAQRFCDAEVGVTGCTIVPAPLSLSESQAATAINALRFAAESYDAIAAQFRTGTPSLARQFSRQAADARVLADDIEAQS